MFSIAFTDEAVEYPYDDQSCPGAPGLLVMGKTWEGFMSNLGIWDKAAYHAHWRNQLTSILAGAPKVALIVSLNDPTNASHSEIWNCYRDGALIRMQNRLLFYDTLSGDFDVSRISDSVGDYRSTGENGEAYSEWTVSERDIEAFLHWPMTLKFVDLVS